MWRPITRNLLACSFGLSILAASGCSAFRANVQDAFVAEPPRHLPDVAQQAANDNPPTDPTIQLAATETVAKQDADTEPAVDSCFVEIRASGEKPRRIRMLLEDATYVQKVLEHTGLVKEFRNMEIELSRKLPDGSRHKLDVRYDTKRNEVVSAFDYALHPNDLLVVTEGSSTTFDEMLKKLAGPLGR